MRQIWSLTVDCLTTPHVLSDTTTHETPHRRRPGAGVARSGLNGSGSQDVAGAAISLGANHG